MVTPAACLLRETQRVRIAGFGHATYKATIAPTPPRPSAPTPTLEQIVDDLVRKVARTAIRGFVRAANTDIPGGILGAFVLLGIAFAVGLIVAFRPTTLRDVLLCLGGGLFIAASGISGYGFRRNSREVKAILDEQERVRRNKRPE